MAQPTASENRPSCENKSRSSAVRGSLREVGQTFVHLVRAPRALWGINVTFLLEGMAYFGVLTILGKYLSENAGLSDIHAGWVYSVFTGGITGAMLVLGGVSDKLGVRRTMLLALCCLVGGRVLLGASGSFFPSGQGAASPMFAMVIAGLLCVVVGFSMFQPAAYAGVRQFTNKKTAAIGFAMVYAVLNLGAFFSGLLSPPVRQGFGMPAVFWAYAGVTTCALLAMTVLLTRKVAAAALASVKADNERFAAQSGQEAVGPSEAAPAANQLRPRRFDPIVIGLALLVALSGSGLLVRAIRAPSPAVKTAMADHAAGVRRHWTALSSGDRSNRPSAATIRQQLGAAASVSMAKPIVEALTVGGVSERDLDGQAFELARAFQQSNVSLLSSLAAEAGPLAAEAGPLAPAVAEPAKARTVRDALRSQALTLMAAAYGLSEPGSVDETVMRGLRARQKELDEVEVPMTDAAVKTAIRWAGQEPRELFESLAQSLDEMATVIVTLLPTAPGAALALCLGADAELNRKLARLSARPLSAVGRAMLSDILLTQAVTALDHARALGVAPGNEASSPAGRHVEARAKLAESLGDSLTEAMPLRLRKAAKRWLHQFGVFALPALLGLALLVFRLMSKRPEHPLRNKRFAFFIFALMPAQTLFAHNWLTLPYYIDRAFSGTSVGANFELFSNLNPLLIFVLTPLIAALTASANVYRMLLLGTLVMAVPTFLLVLPPNPTSLLLYIVLMTVGEAMWQPRFFQLVAELAPEGKTGMYMGIAQLPWFLTKLVTGLYSGWFVASYLPKVGPQSPELMWFVYACIAMVSPVALLLARSWMGSFLEKKSV